MQSSDATDYLRALGEAGDGPHPIAEAALLLSALDHAGRDLEPYMAHLTEIAEHARQEARLATNAENGARALANLLAGRYGYDGDRLSYDDPRNADFIAVIDRRRGLPVALGILYVHAARRPGSMRLALIRPGIFCSALGCAAARRLSIHSMAERRWSRSRLAHRLLPEVFAPTHLRSWSRSQISTCFCGLRRI